MDVKRDSVNGSWFGAWGSRKPSMELPCVQGGEIHFLLSGGAPLSGDTQRFINICLGLVSGLRKL